MTWVYRADAESPSFAVDWQDNTGATRPLATGYTFTVQLVKVSSGAVALTKTTGITGASTAPNVTVAWAVGELNLTPGTYRLHLKARDGSGNDGFFSPGNEPVVEIIPVPA